MTLPGPKILNLGEPGSGKTWVLRTLIEAGVTPFALFTEESTATLGEIQGVKWHSIKARKPDWEGAIAYAKRINTVSIESLAKIADAGRGNFQQFVSLLSCLSNFVDDRTGESFGPVDTWGPGRAIVLDTLTGVNKMALDLVTGGRSIRSLPEWGVAIDQETRLIDNLVSLDCTVIVNAHLETERDEVSGRVRVYASAIGRKLAPTLGRNFGEVLHSFREGDRFFWSTASDDVATKSRLLGPRAKIPQSYVTLLDAWKAQGGVLQDLLPPTT